MVLYKRKAVQPVGKPPLFEDQEIWAIEETDELFTNYDDYLNRMDFYRQKRFICEITGHSNMDYLTALRYEQEASSEVEDAFPNVLREPILRKVQFLTISRIDNLVDHIFERFKGDFFPGEHVTAILDTGERLNGVVRDKIVFVPEGAQPDATGKRPTLARYFVKLDDRPDEEALVDNEHITRDRRVFTKQMLRSFLKKSISREAWTGAPWQVKERIAKTYNIPQEVPPHLSYDAQVRQRKINLNLKRGAEESTNSSPLAPRLPELKPKPKRGRWSLAQQSMQSELAQQRQQQFIEYQRAFAINPALVGLPPGMPPPNEAQMLQFINTGLPPLIAKGIPQPPPPPQPKYPIEDLEIPPIHDAPRRPNLKFLDRSIPASNDYIEDGTSPIEMKSVGILLETWNTLNVYCEVFVLDSFTFDDYIDALLFKTEEHECELLSEIHCSVLKRLINDEKELNGKVQVHLPVAPQEEEISTGDNSQDQTPEPELKRTTRSSLAKAEVAELKAQALIAAKIHRAPEIDQCVKGYDWKQRLRKRDFRDGRWVVILVGLLNLLSVAPRHKQMCDAILAELAPVNMEPTENTAISQYAHLSINHRVEILQLLCMLSLETTAVRSYMEECTVNMTGFRKDKIEQQRARKAAIEELRVLHEERKALQPEDTDPVPEIEDMEIEDVEDSKVVETEDEDAVKSEDEEPVRGGRSLRRANDRAAERKRKLEAEKERKERAEVEKAKKPTKQAKQLEKVLKKIEETKEAIKEYEEEVLTLDNDLRENDCSRTRLLGKDRFWNRYYWLERNAMPYAGLPSSSTASAGYANGCLWVQGPDDLERKGFIELNDVENEQYRRAFQMTVPQRKWIEEGDTHVVGSSEWGYYDEPKDLDDLMGWLEVRGVRERLLKKELQAQRAVVTKYMTARKEFLANEDKEDSGEEVVKTRVSTRTKAYVDVSASRCLKWRNNMAEEEQGHLHSAPPVRKGAKAKKVVEPSPEPVGRTTRGSKKEGKPLTRQGTRYDF